MKKVLALLLACFMGLGVKAAMADTRDNSLGLTAGQQTDGLDSIWKFPQDAANFGNVVDLRMGDPSGNWSNTDSDWGGVIHKDFDDIGYIGVYFNRPFNNSGDGFEQSPEWDNNNGILNGRTNWSNMISPGNSNSGYNSNNVPFNFNTNYPYYPYGTPYTDNATMNYEINWNLGNPLGNGNNYSVSDPQNMVDLFWAKDFSDAVIGLHVNYASGNGANDGGSLGYAQGTATTFGTYNATFKNDASVLGIDLGATLKNVAPNTTLALGLGYSLGMVNYQETATDNYLSAGTQTTYLNETIKDNNISELRANALLKNKVNDNMTARIYGNVRLDNLGFQNNANYDSDQDGTFGNVAREIYVGTTTYTDSNFNLGIACEHNVAEGKAKVIVGLEAIADLRKWTYTALTNLAGSTTTDQVRWGSGSSYQDDNWSVPFTVSIEAPIYDWLTARMGAHTTLWNYWVGKDIYLRNVNAAGTAYQDTATAINSYSWADNLWLTYGLSAKFNNLTIDMQLDPNALLNSFEGLAPGQGILYGNSGNNQQNGGTLQNLAQTIVEVDTRYAF